ncbi:MAG: CorA family divalent cation transporter [Caulobacteraceae bacterium]|nr:CorA family divalent cation transporter [Caulobacteraceae bacterium]
MPQTRPLDPILRPGLIWGFDFVDGRPRPVDDIGLLRPDERPAGFRWLHFNLADQRTVHWLSQAGLFVPRIAETLLSPDDVQGAVIEGGEMALVLHDIELEFWESDPTIGVLRLAVGPSMLITARRHPLRSAEIIKSRIISGAPVGDPAAALELIFQSMTEAFRSVIAELDDKVQSAEDDLLTDRNAPDARAFITMRSLMARLHRLFNGMRSVLAHVRDDGALPDPFGPPAERFLARLSTLDGELLSIQSQLRLVRDELDLQATQRTNQNLYFLSVLTAVFMPATLVTGFFGMNTGGLPWTAHSHGTFLATILVFGSSLAVYLALRLSGVIRR